MKIIFCFVGLIFLLSSCSTQLQILDNNAQNIKLNTHSKLYQPSDKDLGASKEIKVDTLTTMRIYFRDGLETNLADAIVYKVNPTTKIDPTEAIKSNQYYYLIPRNEFGKPNQYLFKNSFRSNYKNIGLFVNPFQFYYELATPHYYEPVPNGNLRLGMYYSFTTVFHKYQKLTYTKNSFSIGPYLNVGFTNLSPVTYKDSTYQFGRNVFGIGGGLLLNYAFDDKLGLGFLIGHETIFIDKRKDWLFYGNNLSLGLVFIFKFVKF